MQVLKPGNKLQNAGFLPAAVLYYIKHDFRYVHFSIQPGCGFKALKQKIALSQVQYTMHIFREENWPGNPVDYSLFGLKVSSGNTLPSSSE